MKVYNPDKTSTKDYITAIGYAALVLSSCYAISFFASKRSREHIENNKSRVIKVKDITDRLTEDK